MNGLPDICRAGTGSPRVLIVDDHAVVRRGLRQILAEAYPSLYTAEAPNGSDALSLVLTRKWDIVLLDLTMPGRGGIYTLTEIKRVRPRLPVLILSMHTEAQYGAWAFRIGAAGFVTKNKAPEELLGAVRKVLSGGRYVSPALAEALAGNLNGGGQQAPHDALSVRELEVLCLIGNGKSLKEIATQLFLSPKTVSTYHVRLMEKMELHSDGELMRYAIDRQLIE